MKSANDMSFDECYDALVELGATEKEIDMACSLKGNTKETLKDVLYVRFGLRDFDQIDDE